MDYFLKLAQADVRRSVSFRLEPAILFCAISATAVPKHAIESLIAGERKIVMCFVCGTAVESSTTSILLSVGFAADVATLRARRFSGHGELGYFISIFLGLARLQRRPFPVRVDGETEFDRRRCLVSYLQQQQIYRRNNDDRAQSRGE